MAKLIATIKAIITRLMFGAHGFIAIWQVTQFKKNPFYWYLSVPMLLLFFEGIFTLTIKKNQEWKWFCPSVFLYLGSVVPAIWLLELDKMEKRMRAKEETFNVSMTADFKELHDLLGDKFRIPAIEVSTEMWVTLIEQFLMLILIIGRWMLPKGDLTRDQLSQLLLVYIGTAADIIEFFDSFKDDKIASNPILVMLTLSIWSWSLMQFTVVLTATKSRKSRLSASSVSKESANCCCNIDVWGILLNITLQDAPFLAFRLLIIIHFNIISYMNVFFTCKNTLVIMLQLYRLYVVFSENHRSKIPAKVADFQLEQISIISKSTGTIANRHSDSEDTEVECKRKKSRKDTGYSTASSHASKKSKKRPKSKSYHSESEDETEEKREKSSKKKNNKKKKVEESSEESEYSDDKKSKRKNKSKSTNKKNKKTSSSESDSSSE